jgi:hypothetical protein
MRTLWHMAIGALVALTLVAGGARAASPAALLKVPVAALSKTA